MSDLMWVVALAQPILWIELAIRTRIRSRHSKGSDRAQ